MGLGEGKSSRNKSSSPTLGVTKEIGITRLITSTHTGQLETEWQLYGRWGDVNELIGHFIADNNSTH